MAEVGFASSKGKDLFSCKEKVVVVTGKSWAKFNPAEN